MNRFALSLAAVFIASAASAAEQRLSLEVSGLTCPSCPYIAASALRAVDTVQIVETAYDVTTQQAVFVLSYDDAVTTPEAIANATSAYGYPARLLEAGSGS